MSFAAIHNFFLDSAHEHLLKLFLLIVARLAHQRAVSYKTMWVLGRGATYCEVTPHVSYHFGVLLSIHHLRLLDFKFN